MIHDAIRVQIYTLSLRGVIGVLFDAVNVEGSRSIRSGLH